MKSNADRRAQYRIENPGAIVRYRHHSKRGFLASYSEEQSVINISKSGICFRIPEEFNFGEKVAIKVQFSDGKTLNLKGHIRWQSREDLDRNYESGIQFNAFGRSNRFNHPKALEYLRAMEGQTITEKRFWQQEKN